MTHENWYLKNKKRIVCEIKFAIPHYKKFITQAYGMELANIVVTETIQRFGDLLPDIPFIDGDENFLTEYLYLSAAMPAMCQSLKSQGKPVEEVARLIYLGTSAFYGSFPFRFLLRWQSGQLFNQKRIEKRRRDAVISQQRPYPDNWVFEIVDGDGENFQFGVNYAECGIVKYLTQQGAPELAPYLCWLDYPMCEAMRVRLIRTETIAHGNAVCNFRFCRGQALEIRPDFLKN